MKKFNLKQSAWQHDQALKRKRKMGLKFIGIMLIFFSALSVTMYATGDASFSDLVNVHSVEGIVGTATVMGLVGNVEKAPNSERVGKKAKYKLWIISEDQWDDTSTFPERSGRERGNIPLKAGEYWHYVEAIKDSAEPKWSGAEGDNAATLTNELTFVLGGMSDATFNLLETGIQEGFFLVWEECGTGNKYLGGTACKPMIMTNFEGGAMKDYTGTTVTFKNESGELFVKYVGNTPSQAAATVAADATTITLTSNPQYQVTDGSAASVEMTGFTAVTDADVGRVVTILGPDTAATYAPTIPDGGDFLLIAGSTWTADENTQISFKIFKDGGATYKFVEIAGTRT